VQTIAPASPLPEITGTVTIDGYSQPGASANTLSTGSDAVLKIQLSPAGVGSGQSGLTITGAGSTVKGLAINRWSGSGVLIRDPGATNNKIEGNYIGTDASGSTALGNSQYGVYIDDADGNVVGGTTPGARNVISGNGRSGVYSIFANDNRVEGNHLGTDASGQVNLGNSHHGVSITYGEGNVVGGTTPGARNVISGNSFYGVNIERSEATGNRVEGNYIGTDASGSEALGNSGDGVFIGYYSENNVVGGATPGAGNVISGNGGNGVLLGVVILLAVYTDTIRRKDL